MEKTLHHSELTSSGNTVFVNAGFNPFVLAQYYMAMCLEIMEKGDKHVDRSM